MPGLQPISQDDADRWSRKALWTIKETALLLHGYTPDKYRDVRYDAELNQAFESVHEKQNKDIDITHHPSIQETYDDIRRAIRAHDLRRNSHAELRPAEVIAWAADRRDLYPKFPFANSGNTARNMETFVDQMHEAGRANQTAQFTMQLAHLSKACKDAEHARDTFKSQMELLKDKLARLTVERDMVIKQRQKVEQGEKVEDAQSSRWPWGEYTTPALDALAEVAGKYCGPDNTDPHPPAKEFSRFGLAKDDDRDAKVMAAILNRGSALNARITAATTNKSPR